MVLENFIGKNIVERMQVKNEHVKYIRHNCNEMFFMHTITVTEIRKIIKGLKPKSSYGLKAI